MCGICGTLARSDDPAGLTRRMLARMHHRGPDDEGIWTREQVSLGHRRLSIVDLSAAGHQPMLTNDGQLVLVANGEIYNYPQLRASLEHKGVRFHSNCDSEVILHGYRAYGTDFFHKLNGMFAFGLYDVTSDTLYVVRDQRGIKPVYYLHDSQRGLFLFASEIKALIATSGAARWRIDPEGLSQYLRLENLVGSKSLFAGIQILEPGHYVAIGRNGLRTQMYWSPAFARPTAKLPFGEAVGRFRDTFDTSVRNHLMSDVPVACYLSSGFDSTLVTSKAAKFLPSPPKAFTGHFTEGGWYDETSGARLVAKHAGVSLQEVGIRADDFAQLFDDMVYSLDEPRMGTGAFSQYVVARAAARERKVILTGHGGDELFSGYPIFKLAALTDGSIGSLASMLRTTRASELPHIAYFLSRRLTSSNQGGHLPLLFSPDRLRRALVPPAFEAVDTFRSFEGIEAIAETAGTDYERILLTYFKVYLPGLLVVEDKISMAHSLEARTPYLDNSLVDLSLSMPAETKLNGGELKAVVKAAARDVLPSEIFRLPKRGFPTPLSHWLRGPLKAWVAERLVGSRTLDRIIKKDFIAREVSSYLSSWRQYVRPLDEIQTHRIWMLLCLESWLRQAEQKLGIHLEL